MAILHYQLPFANVINTSAQVGDHVYYVPVSTVGAFDQSSGNIILFGIIKSIASNSIVVAWDDTNGPALPQTGDYIMFSKEARANVSKVLGYYAEVTLKNNSTDRAELFSVGSEVTENSK